MRMPRRRSPPLARHTARARGRTRRPPPALHAIQQPIPQHARRLGRVHDHTPRVLHQPRPGLEYGLLHASVAMFFVPQFVVGVGNLLELNADALEARALANSTSDYTEWVYYEYDDNGNRMARTVLYGTVQTSPILRTGGTTSRSLARRWPTLARRPYTQHRRRDRYLMSRLDAACQKD